MDWKIIDGIIAAKRRISIEHNFHNSSRLPIRSPRDGSRLARIRCLKRQHCDEKSSDFQRERKKRVTHWFPLHRHLNHKLDKTEQRMKETRPRNSNLPPLPPQIEKKERKENTLQASNSPTLDKNDQIEFGKESYVSNGKSQYINSATEAVGRWKPITHWLTATYLEMNIKMTASIHLAWRVRNENVASDWSNSSQLFPVYPRNNLIKEYQLLLMVLKKELNIN